MNQNSSTIKGNIFQFGVGIILAKTSPTKLTMARKMMSMQSRMRMKRVNVMLPVVVVVSFAVEVLSPSNVIRTLD